VNSKIIGDGFQFWWKHIAAAVWLQVLWCKRENIISVSSSFSESGGYKQSYVEILSPNF